MAAGGPVLRLKRGRRPAIAGSFALMYSEARRDLTADRSQTETMNTLARLSFAASLLLAANHMHLANAQQAPAKKATATEATGGGDVERGRYIVEDVAMCGRCHTPVNDRGQADLTHKLMGAPILNRLPNWMTAAPRIAGNPPGTDEEVITLLSTGIARTGRPPVMPMPQFHMTRKDAESVLAYLKSLR